MTLQHNDKHLEAMADSSLVGQRDTVCLFRAFWACAQDRACETGEVLMNSDVLCILNQVWILAASLILMNLEDLVHENNKRPVAVSNS